MTAVAAILIGAGLVVVPNYARDTMDHNESAAIATLKSISSAQAQMQASGILDRDHDGCGEYGFFAELAGSARLRGGGIMKPPVLGEDFAVVRGSHVVRNGYVFQMFLPDRERRGVAEDANGGDAANDNGVDPDAGERLWCCYAWPVARGWTGNSVFFIDGRGNVLATRSEDVAYEGENGAVPFDAAFAAGEPARMDAKPAENSRGRDGNLWVIRC